MSTEQVKLGSLINATSEPEKDAVHVAVIPVCASEALMPGEHVGKVSFFHQNGKNI